MNRVIVILLAAALAACTKQPTERTIQYLPERPIAERLQPGDTKVVVQMKMSEAPPAKPEALEQELQRLKRSDVIALVRVSGIRSEVADRGTWIRTRVTAVVERTIKPAEPLGESIEFSYGGGSTRIGNVDVTTSVYPKFDEGARYLVFLTPRRGADPPFAWTGVGFRLNDAQALQRIAVSNGGEQTFPTNLVGRDASEIAEALAR